MRIIAGTYRRRTLLSPRGFTTRPIPDRVKESVFGMLGQRVEGAQVVDLFAGSGSVGLEALSRGAVGCLFVERDRQTAEVLRRNIDLLGCADRATVVTGDALGLSVTARCPRPLDVAFVDPPYPMSTDEGTWRRIRAQCAALGRLLAPDGFLLVRTPWPFRMEQPDAGAAGEGPGPSRGHGSETGEVGSRGGEGRRARGTGRGRRAGSPEPFRWDALQRGGRRRARSDENEDREIDGAGDADEGMAPERVERFGTPLSPEEVAAMMARDAQRLHPEGLDSAEHPAGPILGDLSIEGCRGPETHAYGSTAVHWYMRSAG